MIQTIHINICRSLKVVLVKLLYCTFPNNSNPQANHVNLHHIESRPSKQSSSDVEFLLSCDNKTGSLKESLEAVKGIAKNFRVISPSVDTGMFLPLLHVYVRKLFLIIIVMTRTTTHLSEQN